MGDKKHYVLFRAVPTMRCNFRCSYCFVSNNAKSTRTTMFDQHPAEEWVQAMKQFEQYEVEFYFWGGEPFLPDGTYDVVKGWTDYNHIISGSRIDTNMAFATKIAERCPTDKLKLNCSWHPQYHSLDQMYHKVKMLNDLGMVGMVNFVASHQNLNMLQREYGMTVDDLIKKYDDIGVFLNVAADFAIVNGKDPQQYADYKRMILRYQCPEDWRQLRGEKSPCLCEANKHYFTVQSNGDIVTCAEGQVCGNFFNGTLSFPDCTICAKNCPSVVSYCFRTDNSFPFKRHLVEYVKRNKEYRESVGRRVDVIAAPHANLHGPKPTSEGKRPTVSVVLPTYNHMQFLPKAIDSVLGQTRSDLELIVVNDGSTDGTREYLDSLKDPRIRVIHQENKRLPAALNTGFRAARGELLTWISADNYCAPAFLETFVAALEAHPGAGFAYSAYADINEHGVVTDIRQDQDLSYHKMLTSNSGVASFMYRRICQENVGLYDPALEGAEDWDYWLRILEHFETVYIPEVLYYYRRHENGMTKRMPRKVVQASRQVFAKTLERRNHNLDLSELYPTIRLCQDQRLAEFHACFDLGTSLLRSPFAYVTMAVQFLEKAHRMAPDSVHVTSNLAVAHARLGQWEQTLPLLRLMMTDVRDEDVLTICQAVVKARQTNNPESLSDIQLFAPDKKHVELFQLERRSKRVFCPTHSTTNTAIASCQPETRQRAETSPAPMISVVVPTYNRPASLTRALRSILDQTYRNFEIIVVNDAGTDVGDVVAKLNAEQNILYVAHDTNKGLAAARNTGIRTARGKYIAYLDDDDIYLPHHLETLYTVLERANHKVAYTDAYRAHQKKVSGNYIVTERTIPYSFDLDHDQLLVRNLVPVLCVMHEKSCLGEVGYFDESLPTHEDWDLWIRMSKKFKFFHIKKVTAEVTWKTDRTTMTSEQNAPWLRIAEIYEKYKNDTIDKPDVIEQQRRYIQALKQKYRETSRCSHQGDVAAYNKIRLNKSKTVSIIIPVFNNVEYTKQCLKALIENTPNSPYEVVIVDNGSTDGTKEALKCLRGSVKIISNRENLGFAKACNQGAAAADGNYLVFLNNDTKVQPGWSRELVKVLENDPGVGAVGSKLLYPDGSVQHAGVVMLEIEGENALLPRHAFIQQPSDPNFINVPMLFQAVTAACMMVRKSDFARVNGFDESYWNGSEDVDLCFKLAEIGKKIVYQPKSVVTHYESKSGKERHRGIRQNNKLLRERWANKIKPDIVVRNNQVREGISHIIQPYPKCDECISVSRSQYINALICWVQKFFVEGKSLPARRFRFVIKTCTPTRNHLGWGDTPFANSLAKAITKLGNSCEVHFKDEWNQADKHIDVVIHLRGVYPYTPKPNHLNIVWIINHPERQTIEEINQFDIVFCASRIYLERLKNEINAPCFYLPQATDDEVFTPSPSSTTKDIDLLFVGNKYYNDKPRQIIQDVLATGKKYHLCVVGQRWHGFVNKEYYKAEFVEWHKLPELYSRAKIVLNDHHETMSQFGFVNNRTFDLAALKAFQISNYVEGIEEFGIVTYKSPEDLRRKLDYFLQNDGDREEFSDLSHELCEGYNFTNVARKILDVVNRFFNEKTSGKITGYKQNLTRAISRQDVRGEQSSEIESADTTCAAPSGRAVPRVSIITACYNGAKFLPECLNSIRNQSMQEWELFLLDDGSTDGTRSIIEDYARRDARIKPYYFDDNKGPYVRRNFAIERANADFIVIHDADDIMCSDKLERLYEAITQDDQLGVVGSFYRMFLNEFRGIDHTDDVVLATTNDEILDGYTKHAICDFCPHGVAIIRRKLFEELGPYDENPFGSDSLWLAKVAEYASRTNEIRLKNIPRFLTLRRMHSHSQRGRLPCFDPRSRRTRYRQYCECKLRKITEKLRAFPDTDLKTELRNCVCSDFLERFRDHIIRWENEPLDKNVIPELLKNSVWLFNKKFYVNCVSMLNGIEVMAPDIANRFKNYDLLRAMALFALDMKERSRMFLNRELQNHRNTAAKQFISDYFEKRSNTDVQRWCAENADRYDLQMIDTETVAQTASQPI